VREAEPGAFLHTRPAILAHVKGPFQGLHARTLSHATEDLEKVKLALLTAVGSDDITVSRTDGLHGNPIVVLESHVDDDETIHRFFDRLSSDDLGEILRTLEARMDDKCNLFIKLDKQAAFNGTVKLGRNDDVVSVRLRVRAFPAKLSIASAIVIEFIGGLRTTRSGV
jgi:RNA binding exosome subunit